MNRIQRIALISPLVAGLLGGAIFGLVRARSSAGCDEEAVVGLAGPGSAVAAGRGKAAIASGRIVVVDGFAGRSVFGAPGAGSGVLRHITSAPMVGTAYVNDKKGADSLIAVRPGGVSEVAGSGELTHPAWSSSGELVWAQNLRALSMSSPDGPSIKTIPRPEGATAIFSPLFASPNELIAVVQEPVDGYTGADDTLNNLFRYDIASGSWTRLTAFQATAERWSVIRTPVRGPDGTIFFVRLVGNASEARPAAFELWSLRSDRLSKVRDLPKEMFLAGANEQGLMWNIDDGNDWRLFAETSGGLVDLGCGAVMVDPRAQPDPDIAQETPTSDRRSSRPREVPSDPSLRGSWEEAILVGDFSSREEAGAVAARLGLTGLELVTHGTAPLAIAPGKWGVAMRLPIDTDLTAAIADFRRRFPEFADRSWVTTLAGGETAVG
jgi:hypothetical protein